MKAGWPKVGGAPIAVVAIALVGIAIAGRQVGVDRLVHAVEAFGPLGPAALAVIYVPATVFLLPGTVLTFAAGFLFGVPRAVVAVSIGSTIGAAAAFGVARTVGRRWAESVVRKRPGLERLDGAASTGGFYFVLLVRLTPLLPFNLVNYAFGLSGVRFRDYFFGTWLGMLPGTILYVYLGSSADDLSKLVAGEFAGDPRLRAFGLATAVVLAIIAAMFANRALAPHDPDQVVPDRRER